MPYEAVRPRPSIERDSNEPDKNYFDHPGVVTRWVLYLGYLSRQRPSLCDSALPVHRPANVEWHFVNSFRTFLDLIRSAGN